MPESAVADLPLATVSGSGSLAYVIYHFRVYRQAEGVFQNQRNLLHDVMQL